MRVACVNCRSILDQFLVRTSPHSLVAQRSASANDLDLARICSRAFVCMQRFARTVWQGQVFNSLRFFGGWLGELCCICEESFENILFAKFALEEAGGQFEGESPVHF